MPEIENDPADNSDGIEDQPEEKAPEPPVMTPEDNPADDNSKRDTDWKSEAEFWKRNSRELEKRVKGKAEPLKEQLAQARKESEAHAAKALRYEVAADKGLPLDAASRLAGSTKEELEQDAESLKALLGNSAHSPREAYAPGRRPEPEAKHSPNDLIRAALRST